MPIYTRWLLLAGALGMILDIILAIIIIGMVAYFGSTSPAKPTQISDAHLRSLNMEALGAADNIEAFGLTEADLKRVKPGLR